MGPLEPNKVPAHELCVLGEFLAPTQKLATSACNSGRIALLHAPYPHQVRHTLGLQVAFNHELF